MKFKRGRKKISEQINPKSSVNFEHWSLYNNYLFSFVKYADVVYNLIYSLTIQVSQEKQNDMLSDFNLKFMQIFLHGI